MKKAFFEYYTPSEREFLKLWRDAIIAPDANIMLHFIRHPNEYTNTLFEIFEKYKDQLWIPHQAALEYHRNKEETLIRIKNSYKKLEKAMEKGMGAAIGTIKEEKHNIYPHPYLNLDEIVNKIEKSFSRYIEDVQKKNIEHPENNYFVRKCESVADLFDNKIGESFEEELLIKIYKEGVIRYEKNVPPGYKDAGKETDFERYGDLVLWKQIIEKAKNDNRPIIFITDDKKEDWWKNVHGSTVGPRPELRREMYNEAGVDFYLYNFDKFLEYASRDFKEKSVSDKVRKARKYVREYANISDISDKVYFFRHKIQDYDSQINSIKNDLEDIYNKRENMWLPLDSSTHNDAFYNNINSNINMRINSLEEKLNKLNHEKSNLEKMYNRYKNKYENDLLDL